MSRFLTLDSKTVSLPFALPSGLSLSAEGLHSPQRTIPPSEIRAVRMIASGSEWAVEANTSLGVIKLGVFRRAEAERVERLVQMLLAVWHSGTKEPWGELHGSPLPMSMKGGMLCADGFVTAERFVSFPEMSKLSIDNVHSVLGYTSDGKSFPIHRGDFAVEIMRTIDELRMRGTQRGATDCGGGASASTGGSHLFPLPYRHGPVSVETGGIFVHGEAVSGADIQFVRHGTAALTKSMAEVAAGLVLYVVLSGLTLKPFYWPLTFAFSAAVAFLVATRLGPNYVELRARDRSILRFNDDDDDATMLARAIDVRSFYEFTEAPMPNGLDLHRRPGFEANSSASLKAYTRAPDGALDRRKAALAMRYIRDRKESDEKYQRRWDSSRMSRPPGYLLPFAAPFLLTSFLGLWGTCSLAFDIPVLELSLFEGDHFAPFLEVRDLSIPELPAIVSSGRRLGPRGEMILGGVAHLLVFLVSSFVIFDRLFPSKLPAKS